MWIREYYENLGLCVHSTVSQGDCGPDAALCLAGMERTPEAWKKWRTCLSTKMAQPTHTHTHTHTQYNTRTHMHTVPTCVKYGILISSSSAYSSGMHAHTHVIAQEAHPARKKYERSGVTRGP